MLRNAMRIKSEVRSWRRRCVLRLHGGSSGRKSVIIIVTFAFILFCSSHSVFTMLSTLNRILRQTQLQPWRHKMQVRACATTVQSLEDCLGEFHDMFIHTCEAKLTIYLLHMYSPVLDYGGTRMHLNYVWLRDHCRSASSYNSKTHQRNVDTGSIDLTIRPVNTAVQDDQLVLTCESVWSSSTKQDIWELKAGQATHMQNM